MRSVEFLGEPSYLFSRSGRLASNIVQLLPYISNGKWQYAVFAGVIDLWKNISFRKFRVGLIAIVLNLIVGFKLACEEQSLGTELFILIRARSAHLQVSQLRGCLLMWHTDQAQVSGP